MILDTTFLIDVLRGEDAVEAIERRLDDRGDAYVTPITVMELREGTQLASMSDQETAAVESLLIGLHAYDFDTADGRLAGDLAARLAERGTLIDVEDVMIGAMALNRDEPVVTRNEEHFRRLPELTVESY